METDPTPPPYENNSEVITNEKSAEVASEPIEAEAGPSNEQDKKEPHIVVYVSILKKKSPKAPRDFKSSREAIMLSPSSTFKETNILLQKRLSHHKSLLNLPEHAKLKMILYYSIQDGGKDPWLDSNWHNNVRIFDEDSWTACKTLLMRNDKSILMMIVTTVDEVKDISEDDKDEGNSKSKRKSCVVQ
jgi:hypothetical protein